MKKLLTLILILFITTAGYAQIPSVINNERKINDYKHKPGGYQRLITDYQNIPDSQAQSLEKYMQMPQDYQQTQTNEKNDLIDSKSEALGHDEEVVKYLEEEIYTIESVINCNTLKLMNGEEIELIGVVCPKIDKLGQEAIEFVSNLINNPDKKVILEYDTQERGENGRLLAYVYVNCGPKNIHLKKKYPKGFYYINYNEQSCNFLNATIIGSGYAMHLIIPSNVKHDDLLKELYKEAKKQKRGMWAESLEGINTEEAIKSAMDLLERQNLDWGKPTGTRRTIGVTPNGIQWFAVKFKQEENKQRYILVNPETAEAELPKPR